MKDLIIDPEFQSLIPPLTYSEFDQLRENILEDGEVLNPIITWNGIIIDGHNRWKIIQENPEIPYKTYELIFFDRYEAKEWICKNQLGRRNITSEQRMRLIGKMQENRKKSHGGDRGNQYTVEPKGQNEPLPKSTAAQIAEEVGVSESTVKRAEKFSKGIDALQEVSPEAADKILQGKSNVSKVEVASAASMGEEERKAFAKRVMNPPAKPEPKEYTIDDLIVEIEKNAEAYIKFLKSTLVSRSSVYQSADGKSRVLDAIANIKSEISQLEKIIK